jgi:CheY-like chemotaxis protein
MARFLVVDDDPLTVKAMTQLLRSDGHEVASAMSGAGALEALKEQKFDAVVTDLEMPQVDGRAIVRATRECLPAACLIVVSARADEQGRRLLDAGACIVADKPIDYDGLTQAVAECRARRGECGDGECHLKARVVERATVPRRR